VPSQDESRRAMRKKQNELTDDFTLSIEDEQRRLEAGRVLSDENIKAE
jgi:hypothetical protein